MKQNNMVETEIDKKITKKQDSRMAGMMDMAVKQRANG